MRFAGIDLGPDFLQSNQKRLNRIDAAGHAPSHAPRPANLVLTFPMIACVGGEMNPDRYFGLMAFGINPKSSIKDYHRQPLQEAALRYTATWTDFPAIRAAHPCTGRLSWLQVPHSLFRSACSLKDAAPFRGPLPPSAS